MELKDNAWKEFLKDEIAQDYFVDLWNFVESEYNSHVCYPPKNEIFSAFDFCPLNEVKVVILGQDPYHGKGQANGLCFSVRDGVKIPPSLKNIFKELRNDIGQEIPFSGDLTHWAKQGVLMINATLTVREAAAGSHQKKGWETFTDDIIKRLSEEKEHLVFILWGAYAQKKIALIDETKHLVLSSAHPSPLSAHAGFWNNHHFSKTNTYLHENDKATIKW